MSADQDPPQGRTPPKTTFSGPAQYRVFSRAVQLSARQPVDDQMVREVLGDAMLAPYRLAENLLRGRARKTTGEPALAHSVDIAIHARYLGFGDAVVGLALCHDVVEDRASGLAETSRHLATLAATFGYQAAHNVRLMTNRYTLIIKWAGRGMNKVLPFNEKAASLLAAAVARYRDELPPHLRQQFQYELRQILDYFLRELSFSGEVGRAEVDTSYTAFDEVALRSYQLYVEEMADAVASRGSVVPLIVKSLDLVDNLRTSEVATLWSMDRARYKAEMFLDKTFWLVMDGGMSDTAFPLVYDYVKNELVEQLRERNAALDRLSDSRFWVLAEYYREQITRLEQKYKVVAPEEAIPRLQQQIMDFNRPR